MARCGCTWLSKIGQSGYVGVTTRGESRHVPVVYEYGTQGPYFFIAMEYIDGKMLSQRLGRHRFTALQASRRTGLLDCELRGDRVVLGGHAVTVLDQPPSA